MPNMMKPAQKPLYSTSEQAIEAMMSDLEADQDRNVVIGNLLSDKISVLEQKAALELGGVSDLYDNCGRKPCANWYKNRSFWGMEAGLRLLVDQA